MVMQSIHGWRPMQPTQTMPSDSGATVTPARPMPGKPPSLPPHKIAEFARQFANDAAPFYTLWRECTDVLSNWRDSPVAGVPSIPGTLGVAQWMRARDVTIPLVQQLYRNVVARLSVETPSVGVVPATESADDIQKAQATEQAARYLYRACKTKDTIRDAVEWMVVHGTAGLLTYMDGDDVAGEAIEPERLRAEPGVHDPKQSRFLGVTRITTREALTAQFADRAQLPDESDEEYAQWLATERPAIIEAIEQAPAPKLSVASGGRFGTREAPDRVEVLEAYCKSGHYYFLVGDAGTVLAQGMTPGGCMPLQVIRYTKIPGKFFGMGMVELIRDVQYSYVSVLNQMLRNARLMSNPKVLIERSAKVDENAFTSAVGEKVLYTGVKPDVWVPPGLPSYFQTLPPLLQSLMHDLAGIHSTSTGKRASGITSGRAIEALSANDMAQFQSTQDAIEAAVSDDMRCKLLFMKEYYPLEKVVRQFDQYGRAVFQTLRSTDLSSNPEVFIESGTLFSAEVKDRDQRTLDLMRLGLLGPEEGRKMLSFHLDPMAPVKTIADIEHARRTLGKLVAPEMAGQPPQFPQFDVYPSDNLKVFDDVFGGYIRSPDYDGLTPDRQQAVHLAYLKILAMQAPQDPTAPTNEDGKIPQMPGAPDQVGGSLMPGAGDLTKSADAAVDSAEAMDEQTM